MKTVQLTEAKGTARGRPRGARRVSGDADLDRGHGDPDPGGGDQAARALDPGRDRDAAAGRRAGVDARARRGRGRAERGRGRRLATASGDSTNGAVQTSSTPTSSWTQPTSPTSPSRLAQPAARRPAAASSGGRVLTQMPAPSSSPAATVRRGASTSLQCSASARRTAPVQPRVERDPPFEPRGAAGRPRPRARALRPSSALANASARTRAARRAARRARGSHTGKDRSGRRARARPARRSPARGPGARTADSAHRALRVAEGGGGSANADELGVGVGRLAAGGAALVDEREHGAKPAARADSARSRQARRDGLELGFGEIGERERRGAARGRPPRGGRGRARLERRCRSRRCLPLDEHGVHVRHDADPPAGSVGLAVGSARASVSGGVSLSWPSQNGHALVPGVGRGRQRPPGPDAAAGRDDDAAPRQRVAAQFRVGARQAVGRCGRPESAAASRGTAGRARSGTGGSASSPAPSSSRASSGGNAAGALSGSG